LPRLGLKKKLKKKIKKRKRDRPIYVGLIQEQILLFIGEMIGLPKYGLSQPKA